MRGREERRCPIYSATSRSIESRPEEERFRRSVSNWLDFDGPGGEQKMERLDPLEALLSLRRATQAAIDAIEGYGYEDIDARLKALREEAKFIFRDFDRYYSD
jgi:hypothetical protein